MSNLEDVHRQRGMESTDLLMNELSQQIAALTLEGMALESELRRMSAMLARKAEIELRISFLQEIERAQGRGGK